MEIKHKIRKHHFVTKNIDMELINGLQSMVDEMRRLREMWQQQQTFRYGRW